MLAERGLVAICKVVLTNREHLVALDPFWPTMLLSTLYWSDEIRSPGELDLPTADVAPVRPVERAMAERLVAAMTEAFDPAAYRDEYRDALMTIIGAKVSRTQTVVPEPAAERGTVIDLMAALEASVAAARGAQVAASALDRVERRAAKGGSALAQGPADTSTAGAPTAAASRDNSATSDAAAVGMPEVLPAATARGARRRKTA